MKCQKWNYALNVCNLYIRREVFKFILNIGWKSCKHVPLQIITQGRRNWGDRGSICLPTPPLCVEIGFFTNISQESRCNSKIKVWAHFYKILVFIMSLPTPSQSVSHKRFHQCVNHKKKLSLRQLLVVLVFSIWLGVDKVLQKLTKSYKVKLRNLF